MPDRPATQDVDATPPATQDSAPLPLLDARTLRALGETADGHRDKELFLVKSGSKVVLRHATDKLGTGEVKIATVRTASMVPNRDKPDVQITPLNSPTVPLKEYDALFWTESAIEKFILPYYRHMRILKEEEEKILEAYKKREVVALAHVPPSKTRPISVEGVESLAVIQSGKNQAIPLLEFLGSSGGA